MIHSNQILHGNQTRGENVTWFTTLRPWTKIFVTEMLMHDQFAVANPINLQNQKQQNESQ